MSSLKHITVRAELPDNIAIGDLSRKYPNTIFKITNGHWIALDERILYITCDDWKKEYFDFLKKHDGVLKIDNISNIVKLHIRTSFLKRVEQKEITIVYPTMLRNGFHRIEFMIDKKQLYSLKKGLANMKILKITDSYKSSVDLTDRQKEILWKAQSFGYFEYPRGITLTDLAKLLKISKATLSQIIRQVENKAIKLLLER